MGESPWSEQRRHRRISVRQRCWCEGANITVYTQMGNISEGGLCLRTQAPLAPGERVRVRLRDNSAELELQAAVVWRVAPGQEPEVEPGVGLRFDGNDAAASAALRRHVAQLMGSAA
jgi:uncharacterized protein (TIGR02266 family)